MQHFQKETINVPPRGAPFFPNLNPVKSQPAAATCSHPWLLFPSYHLPSSEAAVPVPHARKLHLLPTYCHYPGLGHLCHPLMMDRFLMDFLPAVHPPCSPFLFCSRGLSKRWSSQIRSVPADCFYWQIWSLPVCYKIWITPVNSTSFTLLPSSWARGPALLNHIEPQLGTVLTSSLESLLPLDLVCWIRHTVPTHAHLPSLRLSC